MWSAIPGNHQADVALQGLPIEVQPRAMAGTAVSRPSLAPCVYSNFRKDGYGGPVENRIRFPSEIAEAMVAAVGAEQVGVRLSPNGEILGVNDADPVSLFTAAAERLREIGVADPEVREAPEGQYMLSSDTDQVRPAMRQTFGGTFILNSDFDKARAEATVANGEADAISFGRLSISNPNLPAVPRQGISPIQATRRPTARRARRVARTIPTCRPAAERT